MFLASFEPQIGALLEYHLGAVVMAPDDDSYFRRAIYYVVAMFLERWKVLDFEQQLHLLPLYCSLP